MNKNLLTIFVIALIGGAIFYVQKSGIISITAVGGSDNGTLIQEIGDRASAISSMLSRVQAIQMNTAFLKSPEFNSLIPLNAVILAPTNLGRENPFLEMSGNKKAE